jgi:Fe-S cluster assembly iron-binding protein IscA
MNERIKQLAVQAELPLLDVDGNCKYGDTYFSKEKFAELLVKECMSYMKDGDIDFAKFMIKRNFGVEE